MLVPAPPPAYTLSPGMAPLTEGQEAALHACLASLTGRLGAVLVANASTTAHHHVIELLTQAGTLLVMERVQSVPQVAGAIAR